MKSQVYEEVQKHGKIFIPEKKKIKNCMHPMTMAMQRNSKTEEEKCTKRGLFQGGRNWRVLAPFFFSRLSIMSLLLTLWHFIKREKPC